MVRIKVCGLTDPLNTREAVETGIDFAGFIFYRQSKRYVGDNPDAELFMNIPHGIRKVGVFVNEKPDIIIEKAKRYDLAMIQLHGDETTEFCKIIKDNGFETIKAFGIYPGFDFNALIPFMKACDFFMFDSKTVYRGGSGIRFDWNILREYDLDKPFFLSGGIGPEDGHAVRNFGHKAFYAADINSRFEIGPGIKDMILVKSFIHEIKTNLE